MKIQFLGAAQEVTGSKHLIITEQGKRILLDCGMFQGKGMETDRMNRELGFDPKEIDCLILSHAHIDHSGLIPYIHKLGFRGTIYSTPATRDLCSILLADTAFIQALDVKWYNKKQRKLHLPAIAPLYEPRHAEECMRRFVTIDYGHRFQIDTGIHLTFTHSGHMLGSAVINLEIEEKGKTKRIAYTGDIGRGNNPILKSPDAFPQCDYLICESTYGNRLHEEKQVSEEELLQIVRDTCVHKRGKLIIPSFSVGRTQEIVYVLNKLYNEQRLPMLPVYVDSPLSVNATQIFRLYTDALNDDVKQVMQTDPDPFGFNTLKYITDVTESKKLNKSKQPCIIISASGMLEAGRVKHHVANQIDKPSTTILMVGYCTPTSLGARLQEPGLKEISIFGMLRKVRAEIKRIDSFSGHGDYKEMIRFLSCQNKQQLQKLFLVHGEEHVQQDYARYLQQAGFQHIEIPAKQETYEL